MVDVTAYKSRKSFKHEKKNGTEIALKYFEVADKYGGKI